MVIYNIFGSESSLDYDIMVKVDNIPSIQDSKNLCAKFEEELKLELPDKKRNVNLAVVKDGEIVETFKGTPDECNNSVLTTYSLHKQKHYCLVDHTVERDIPLKLARGIRIILSFMSRTEHRKLVKDALKGDIYDKINALRKIRISSIENLGKNGVTLLDFRKQIAFQFGQCLGLLDGVELYTKEDIASYFPSTEPYLFRREELGICLDMYKHEMLRWMGDSDIDFSLITEER